MTSRIQDHLPNLSGIVVATAISLLHRGPHHPSRSGRGLLRGWQRNISVSLEDKTAIGSHQNTNGR
jgi:hypothetical protein